MTPARWARIGEIFRTARERPEPERAGWLGDACGGDQVLRAEVERLLAQDDESLPSPAASLLTQAVPALAEGETLSHYRVEAKIGEGGMGSVYRAYDTRLRRRVALKVLPPEHFASPESGQRLMREARAAAALNHPNIVGIHEVGSENGVDFIAMEFVDGTTLTDAIPAKGMPLAKALDYAVQIAGGLVTAHAAGVIHRDLKPGNIMLTADGLVKLLDFGLARRMKPEPDSETTLTVEGKVFGTPSYMSPEQAQGKAVDVRSDIFAFGAVLYEMLGGERAFGGDSTAAVLAAVLRQEPPPFGTKVPRELQNIVKRCLHKDPERRFQNAGDVKVALLELKERSESGQQQFREETGGRKGRKRMFVYAATAAAVAGIALALWLRSGAEPVEMLPAPLTALPGDEATPSFSPDGKQVAFSWNGDKRGNYEIYVKLIGSGNALRLTTDQRDDHAPAWSPDGRWIAFLRDAFALDRDGHGIRQVVLAPVLGGQERVVGEVRVRGSIFVPRISWSPDGKWLAVPHSETGVRPFSIYLLSVERGEMRRLTWPPVDTLGDGAPAFSPSGDALAFSRSPAGEVWILRLTPAFEPRGQPERLTGENGWLTTLTWTPDGREIVYSSGQEENTILRRVAAAGGPSRVLAAAGRNVTDPTIRGARLAYVARTTSHSIWRLNIDAGGKAAAPPGKFIASTRLDNCPDYSPDGKKIVFVSCRGGPWQLWIADADGSSPAPLTDVPESSIATMSFPSWSPDGRLIAFDARIAGNANIFLVNAGGGVARRFVIEHSVGPTWSRDGRWIYHARWGKDWAEWKSPTGAGNPGMVVKQGIAVLARESADNRGLYFLDMADSRVYKVAIAGGVPPVAITPSGVVNFAVRRDGLYLLLKDGILFQRFDTLRTTWIARIESRGWRWGFSVSPSGESILYDQRDEFGGDVLLIENFR